MTMGMGVPCYPLPPRLFSISRHLFLFHYFPPFFYFCFLLWLYWWSMPIEYEEIALDACNDLPHLHCQLIGFLLFLSQKSGFLRSCAGGEAELVDDFFACPTSHGETEWSFGSRRARGLSVGKGFDLSGAIAQDKTVRPNRSSIMDGI
ncbi:hypothetical protein ACFX1Q_040841 [Malus domestica]